MDNSSSNATQACSRDSALESDRLDLEKSNQAENSDPEPSVVQPGKALSQRLLLALAVCLLVAPAIICFVFMRDNAVNVPYMDEWHILNFLRAMQTGNFDYLAFLNVQDAEHKIFVPYATILMVASITKYNGIALVFTIYAIVALQFAILSALTWPLVRERKSALLLLCPISWMLFSVNAWENLLWTPQTAHTLCVLFALACVYLLNRSRSIDLSFAGAALSALAATYCIANGVSVWAVGLLQMLLQKFIFFGQRNEASASTWHRHWWQKLVIWIALAAGVITLYVTHLNLHVHGDNYRGNLTLELLRHDFPGVVQFYLACLGTPLSAEKYVSTAMACMLLFVFGSALYSLRNAKAEERAKAVVPITIFAFVLGTALLILLGRFGGGTDAAMRSRYCVYTNVGVSAIYMLLLALGPAKTQFQSMRMGIMIALVCVGAITTWQYGVICGDEFRTHRVALLNAIRHHDIQSDETTTHYADVDAETLHNGIPFIESQHLSLFADPPPITLDGLRRTTTAPAFLLETTNSERTHTYPLQKHFVIDRKTQRSVDFRGWAIDFTSRGPCPAVFVDIDDKLDIPTTMGIPRRDVVHMHRRSGFLYSGFVGTCRTDLLPAGVHTVRLKIVMPDKQTYYLTGPLLTIEVL